MQDHTNFDHTWGCSGSLFSNKLTFYGYLKKLMHAADVYIYIYTTLVNSNLYKPTRQLHKV